MNRSVLVVATPKHCLGCVFRTMNLQHQFICSADGRVITDINIRDPECKLEDITMDDAEIDDGK